MTNEDLQFRISCCRHSVSLALDHYQNNQTLGPKEREELLRAAHHAEERYQELLAQLLVRAGLVRKRSRG